MHSDLESEVRAAVNDIVKLSGSLSEEPFWAVCPAGTEHMLSVRWSQDGLEPCIVGPDNLDDITAAFNHRYLDHEPLTRDDAITYLMARFGATPFRCDRTDVLEWFTQDAMFLCGYANRQNAKRITEENTNNEHEG